MDQQEILDLADRIEDFKANQEVLFINEKWRDVIAVALRCLVSTISIVDGPDPVEAFLGSTPGGDADDGPEREMEEPAVRQGQ